MIIDNYHHVFSSSDIVSYSHFQNRYYLKFTLILYQSNFSYCLHILLSFLVLVIQILNSTPVFSFQQKVLYFTRSIYPLLILVVFNSLMVVYYSYNDLMLSGNCLVLLCGSDYFVVCLSLVKAFGGLLFVVVSCHG